MSQSVKNNNITMYETQGCLVVPIQEELSIEAAKNIQHKLLEQIYSKSIKGVIIDLSGVDIIDSILWEVFSKTTQMIQVIGFPTLITGLSPGVVASIIELNLEIKTVRTAMNLEAALEILTDSNKTDIDDTEKDEQGYDLED